MCVWCEFAGYERVEKAHVDHLLLLGPSFIHGPKKTFEGAPKLFRCRPRERIEEHMQLRRGNLDIQYTYLPSLQKGIRSGLGFFPHVLVSSLSVSRHQFNFDGPLLAGSALHFVVAGPRALFALSRFSPSSAGTSTEDPPSLPLQFEWKLGCRRKSISTVREPLHVE